MGRVLRWDGCVNVRDLGGLPLAGGGETAYRVVVRADSRVELPLRKRMMMMRIKILMCGWRKLKSNNGDEGS